MDRVMVFIDGPNIGQRADLVKLLERLLRGRPSLQSLYYHTQAPASETRYPELLRAFGVTLKPVPRGGKKRERVDVALSVDLLAAAYEDQFDIAIVVTGDGDFAPVITKVTGLGKRVEIAGFRDSLSSELKSLGCDVHYLDHWRKHIRR